MLDLEQDLAEELGMEPSFDLLQLEDMNQQMLEAADDELAELDEDELEILRTKQGEAIKNLFDATEKFVSKAVADDGKCFYKMDGSGSIYATSLEQTNKTSNQ